MNIKQRFDECKAYLRMYNGAKFFPGLQAHGVKLRNTIWDRMSEAQQNFCLQRLEW